MDNFKVLERMKQTALQHPTDIGAYSDYFALVRAIAEEDYGGDRRPTLKSNEWLRNTLTKSIKLYDNTQDMQTVEELIKRTYLWAARDDFHSYLLYLEWGRKPRERFYQPRMKIMKRWVDAIQDLVDDKLDELFLSCPPRVGKSTLLMFLCTWLVGRDSERSNLYSAFSDTITTAFYNGCLEVLKDPTTYLWKDVFPASKIVSTNAKDETFNIDRAKRYPSLTCRSLYGTLNGACDCDGFLISDDLIGGIEEALNKDRLVAAWSKVDNNLLPRAKEKAKILWCGTRWSIADPAGLRMDLLHTDSKFKSRRFKVINIPALGAKGKSNFEYDYGVGFSTAFYEQRRASFEHNNDMASWEAQYMGEPVERTGVLFEPQDMKYYNGELPGEEQLVRVFMAVDPAFGGGDFTAAPILYQYDDGSIYVHDVVYSDADKRITQPLIVEAIKRNKVSAVQVEANASTVSYKEKIEELLKKDDIKVNITTKPAPTHVAKETRIFDKAPEIRDLFFVESGRRSKEYDQFMRNLFAFKINSKARQHDDAPDSLCQAIDMIIGNINRVRVVRRTF